MQHTEKYQLNLIDPSDTFSPEPLNQNAETVEAQLAAVDDKFTAADAAIQKNLDSGGKTARIAFGSYVGNDEYGKEHPNVLTFDFKPVLVCVMPVGSKDRCYILMRPYIHFMSNDLQSGVVTRWGDRTVQWFALNSDSVQCNYKGITYGYFAIGEPLE